MTYKHDMLGAATHYMYFAFLSFCLLILFTYRMFKLSSKIKVYLVGTFIAVLSLFILFLNRNQTIFEAKIILSEKILIDDNWQFSFDEHEWIGVTLPHTPRIESIEKTEPQWQGICYYRKQIIIDDTSSHFILWFEAAMHEADIWINEQHTLTHYGGYLPFYITLPENDVRIFNILVQLKNTDNQLIPPGKKLSELDFNYYGGLYRHVWLFKKSKRCHFHHSIRIHYENVTKYQAIVVVEYKVIGKANYIARCHVQFLLDQFEIQPFATSQNVQAKFSIDSPRLWSPSQPNLYNFTLRLVDRQTEIIIFDQETITIGIRSFEFHPDSQYLFLNGEKFDYIVGTNRHQEYPYIGYALSDSAQYREAYKIKQAGFNLVRCSHYPPASAFLDACDYYGLLVINAIPGWQYFGDETFQNNSYNDIENMIERDYNHPSILLWEVSLNESPMSNSFMNHAHNLLKINKPDAHTCGWIDDEKAYDVFIPARQHRNAPDYFKNYRAKNNKIIFIAEYGDWEYYSTATANFNQMDANNQSTKHNQITSRQRRKDGQKRLLQQVKNFQQAHNDNRRASQTTRIMGDANWLMFDYKRGYATDIEASGIMDINRLSKFVYFFYQSQCISCSPMIFIANYWNDPSLKTVVVYSNCEHVELRLNNKLINNSRRQHDEDSSHLLRPPFLFEIDEYIAGRLDAIGFVNGKLVVQTARITPEKFADHLHVAVDLGTTPLRQNDVVFVYAYINDAKNTTIPDATDFITFSFIEMNEQAYFIGENPVRAEAGIATILLKTRSIMTVQQLTITASCSTIKCKNASLVIDVNL